MKKYIAVIFCLFGVYVHAEALPTVQLTNEQCGDWVDMEYLSLTAENKEFVRASCAKRYSSDNAMGNCTAFEGEDFLKHLKELAKTQCKQKSE
ncbi:hypothetical protein [Oceanobacter mangrovi]|uniref:hypothetical protein n=1 Tax=Oceanobacter mangrovi TaxID=2862510 RepID=UPI001C8E1D5B|nr:hypothetical protein [Oceanobacter mangrovi]